MCEMPYFTWAAVCKGFPEGHASVVDALALVCQIAFLCVPEVCANVIGGISGLDVHVTSAAEAVVFLCQLDIEAPRFPKCREW